MIQQEDLANDDGLAGGQNGTIENCRLMRDDSAGWVRMNDHVRNL